MKNIFRTIVALTITLGAGAVGSAFTISQIPGWYTSIAKPPFNPPSWLFAPIWTVLYILMAFALVRIWDLDDTDERRRWFIVFALQFALNVMWSVFFFGLHAVLVSCIDIAFLWILALILFLDACKMDRRGAYLLAPYLAWVSFAAVLDVSIWWMN